MTLVESVVLIVFGVLLIGAGMVARRVVESIEAELEFEKKQRQILATLRGDTPDDDQEV